MSSHKTRSADQGAGFCRGVAPASRPLSALQRLIDNLQKQAFRGAFCSMVPGCQEIYVSQGQTGEKFVINMRSHFQTHRAGRFWPLSGGGVVTGLGLMLIALCLTCSVGRAAELIPTGVPEIDAMRREFAVNPTTPENAPRRHSLIFSWVRHLVHRGVDMTDFHDACANFSKWGAIDPSRYEAMKQAFNALETIQANPSFIKEVRGSSVSPSPTGRAGRKSCPFCPTI